MLIAATREPVEIEIVGGDGFIPILLTLLGPILVALAAVVAAFVAARTANRRQQRQLSHDLVVRSMEHIRDAIDTAVEGVHETVKAMADLELSVPAWEESKQRLEAELQETSLPENKRTAAQEQLIEGIT